MLFLRQLCLEIIKLFARKRTWIGFGAFFTLEIVMLFLLQRDGPKRFYGKFIGMAGGLFDEYYRGLTLAFLVLAYSVLLLGALALSLVGGDIVAKEVEDGTMRMTLCRPVSRLRVLAVKYLTALFYCGVLAIFIGLSAYLTGLAWRGAGGLLALAPEHNLQALWPEREGTIRYLCGLPLLGISLCSIVSLAFLFSCCNAKPAAALALTMTFFTISFILNLMPQFAEYKPYFITHRMSTWAQIFQQEIPWMKMLEDYLYLFGFNATMFIVGSAIFCRRDFKS
jgi:ABC-2 type transport system permease protein